MKNKTVRSIVLDYVQANGPQSWSDLHRVVLTVSGRNLNENHWGIGYLDQVSASSVCFPTRKDGRFLKKMSDNKYHLFESSL